MAKRSYHHGNLREALIDAATEMVEAGGVEAFSIAGASRSVGVSHAAAYKHFADRSALLHAVSDRAMAAFGHDLQVAAGAHAEAREQYLATGRAVVHFARTRPHLYALAFQGTRRDDLSTLANPPPQTVLDQFIALIRTWQGADWLGTGDPSEVALVLWASAHGLAVLVASGRLDVSAEEAATLVDTVLLRVRDGIGPR